MDAIAVWDLVKVPFPYADQPVHQYRPALVIACPEAHDRFAVLWVLMVTSAANRGWPGDVPVSAHAEAGLPVASVVRTEKIATIDRRVVQRVGRLPAADQANVVVRPHQTLAGVSL